jgi:hypothetical protein
MDMKPNDPPPDAANQNRRGFLKTGRSIISSRWSDRFSRVGRGDVNRKQSSSGKRRAGHLSCIFCIVSERESGKCRYIVFRYKLRTVNGITGALTAITRAPFATIRMP